MELEYSVEFHYLGGNTDSEGTFIKRETRSFARVPIIGEALRLSTGHVSRIDEVIWQEDGAPLFVLADMRQEPDLTREILSREGWIEPYQ